MRSLTLDKVKAAAELYHRGGKTFRVYYAEAAAWGINYMPAASGEGKERAEVFLRFLNEIILERDEKKRLQYFLALIQSLLDSTSTQLKTDICNAIFDRKNALFYVKALIKNNSAPNSMEYQMAFRRYSPEVNKPGVLSRGATTISTLWSKKKRPGTPEQMTLLPEYNVKIT